MSAHQRRRPRALGLLAGCEHVFLRLSGERLVRAPGDPARRGSSARACRPAGRPCGGRHHGCDVGCGQGTQAVELAARGLEVIGVDPSEDLLGQLKAKAVERGVSVRAIVGGVDDLDSVLQKESVDLVCAHGLLMYLPDARQALRQLMGNPGHRISLTVRNGDALAYRPGARGQWRAALAFHSTSYVNSSVRTPGRTDSTRFLAGAPTSASRCRPGTGCACSLIRGQRPNGQTQTRSRTAWPPSDWPAALTHTDALHHSCTSSRNVRANRPATCQKGRRDFSAIVGWTSVSARSSSGSGRWSSTATKSMSLSGWNRRSSQAGCPGPLSTRRAAWSIVRSGHESSAAPSASVSYVVARDLGDPGNRVRMDRSRRSAARRAARAPGHRGLGGARRAPG